MKRPASFRVALAFWFVAGMTTEVTASRALDHWREIERRTHYDTLCSVRGGTLIHTRTDFRCVTCNAP